ncbi:MAG: sialate O-acetylesterase [Eubacteriales bacterium]|nr:sialate O-acetylesterase [Eubacteriales bacterium]
MIRLSALFSDGMVLQREVKNCIWGYAEQGDRIEVSMDGFQAETVCSEAGYFEAELPEYPAGGPHELKLRDGKEEIRIRDILFGDVFLLGGQSNMELPVARVMERYGQELAQTMQEEIRMFEVPKEYVFGELRQEITKGCWLRARGEELQSFSAAGYFAAREIQDREGIPVGLLQTAVGGTPVKAWCCEETIARLGYDTEEIEECRRRGYPEKVMKEEEERDRLWRQEALRDDGSQKSRERGRAVVPGFFEGTALEQVYGGVRFTKTITLLEEEEPEKWEGTLFLGAMIDADVVSVNGMKIGETGYRYPPRIYPIPKDVLHAGENIIEIRLLVFGEGGGFMPGKDYGLYYGKNGKKADLTGEWEYEMIQKMENLPQMTFFQYKACGLYQGMLWPVRKWNVKGCFFYQGESNTGRPETYEEEFTAMIADWRALWKMPEMPFIFVQLAGFSDGKLHTDGTEWAKLREAQKRCEKIPKTRMVQAYDLGEYNDLHPTDKKTVGERIALAAETLIYQKPLFCENPKLCGWKRQGQTMLLAFGPSGVRLHTEKRTPVGKSVSGGAKEQETVHSFEVIAEDGSRRTISGKLLEDGRVELLLPERAAGISYAWNDCPWEANLYSEEELPVIPFEIRFGKDGKNA